MMRDTNAYDRMRELIKKHPDNIAVLEDEIDVALQMEYFKESNAVKKGLNKTAVLIEKDNLFNNFLSLEEKRILLTSLASVSEVEAFRCIEKYLIKPDESLREWAILAFQESKMLMETVLSGTAPIFISTGLGGKGKKLRYFIVVTSNNRQPLNDIQQNIIKSEFEFGFNANEALVEDVIFYGYAVAVTGIIPIEIGLKEFLSDIIRNCNDLGNFLNESFMVTNVKKLTFEEIEKAIDDYETNLHTNNQK